MTYAIILAGGKGSRFWPVSRVGSPKQFLPVCSGRPMLTDTMQRIGKLIKYNRVYIAAGSMHRRLVMGCLANSIPKKNIFFEPQPKSTLAPIAVLSKQIHDMDLDAVIVVVPADHYIRNPRLFRKVLTRAITAAQTGRIVTLGITPTRPETGYGYIEARVSGGRKSKAAFYEIARFIEKPGLIRARRFVRRKNFYWNSGIFVFRVDVVLKEIKRLAPQVHQGLRDMATKKRFLAAWRKLPDISFDYAVMEKAPRAAVIPCDCGWTDVGSWQALGDVLPRAKNNNIFRGPCLDVGSTDTFVWSSKRLVATCGLNGLIIVDTPDALLVTSKDRSQDVKRIVERLTSRQMRKLL
jgi:mannose-1-phosphate guanylyltransferase